MSRSSPPFWPDLGYGYIRPDGGEDEDVWIRADCNIPGILRGDHVRYDLYIYGPHKKTKAINAPGGTGDRHWGELSTDASPNAAVSR